MILNHFYEWPKTRQEYNIFFKEVFRLPNFWKDLGKKIAWNLVAHGGDTALKLSAWQYVYGGTWSPQEYADSNVYKPLVCGVLAFGPTAWLTVPFENASRAYYADKTWPIELRRNYTSPTQALFRIPFEEGITYLFKGGFPLIMNQAMFWTIYVNFYIFLKNKFFLFWVYNDFSYEWCKFCFQSIAFGIASTVAYPAYMTREMVDLWPKERGGFCTWNNSYRQCFKWMVENMELHMYNYMRGYTGWVRKYGFQYFIGLWMADSLGMMTNCNESWNGLEVQFPLYSESS